MTGDSEAGRLFRPGLMDQLGGREAAQGLEPPGVVVSIHEELEVFPEPLVRVVVVPLDGRVLGGAIHSPDLPIGPGVVHLGEPVFDVVLVAHAIEGVLESPDVLLTVGELDIVVGE